MELERTIEALERKGNLRVLICVAECWRLEGEPSLTALLAQVRAFLELRANDRAWARLVPLLDDPQNAEVYHLAGRILIDQGRFAQAVRLLRQGLEQYPGHSDLKRQLSRSEQPNTVIDRTDPVQNNCDGLVRLAEHHLSTGSQVRARAVLTRVLTIDPEHARATDLLWVLDGDFELRGIRLSDLTRIYAGPKGVHDLAAFDDSIDDERTETAGPSHVALLEEPRISGGFPNLFKNLEPKTELEPFITSREATAFADPSKPRAALPVWSGNTHQDTQIQRIVRKPPVEGEDGIDTQIEAVDDSDLPPTLGGESEDEDVVVHRPGITVDFGDRTESYHPLRVDPARDRLPEGANTADEGADFVRLPPRRKLEPELEPVTAPPLPEPVRAPEPAPAPEPVAAIPLDVPPPADLELEPASLPPPLDDDFDLSELYPQPVVSWTAWLALGMLLGGAILAVVGLITLASLL